MGMHVRALGAKYHYISVVGQDNNAKLLAKQLNGLKVKHTLIEDIRAQQPLKFDT